MGYRCEEKATKSKWILIAGRGALGDHNWGGSFKTPPEELEKQRQELLKHIGETVLLSGGGGPGFELVKLLEVYPLEDAPLREPPGRKAFRAKLGNCSFGEQFDPYLDSWQISVKAVKPRSAVSRGGAKPRRGGDAQCCEAEK